MESRKGKTQLRFLPKVEGGREIPITESHFPAICMRLRGYYRGTLTVQPLNCRERPDCGYWERGTGTLTKGMEGCTDRRLYRIENCRVLDVAMRRTENKLDADLDVTRSLYDRETAAKFSGCPVRPMKIGENARE